MLHLVPQWQSSARHERLKEVMADRPDLIQSELAVSPLSVCCSLFVLCVVHHMPSGKQDHHLNNTILFVLGAGL